MIWNGESAERLEEISGGYSPQEISDWNGGLDYTNPQYGRELIICSPQVMVEQQRLDSLTAEQQKVQRKLDEFAKTLNQTNDKIDGLQRQNSVLLSEIKAAKASMDKIQVQAAANRAHADSSDAALTKIVKTIDRNRRMSERSKKPKLGLTWTVIDYSKTAKQPTYSPNLETRIRGRVIIEDFTAFVQTEFSKSSGTLNLWQGEILASGGGGIGYESSDWRLYGGALGGAVIGDAQQPFAICLLSEASYSHERFKALGAFRINLDKSKRCSLLSEVTWEFWPTGSKNFSIITGVGYEYLTQMLTPDSSALSNPKPPTSASEGQEIQDHLVTGIIQLNFWRCFSIGGRVGLDLAAGKNGEDGRTDLYGQIAVTFAVGKK